MIFETGHVEVIYLLQDTRPGLIRQVLQIKLTASRGGFR